MNARTSKLIKRLAAGSSIRAARKGLKRAWNKTPRPLRHALRAEIKEQI
jgi:hypothetical protein